MILTSLERKQMGDFAGGVGEKAAILFRFRKAIKTPVLAFLIFSPTQKAKDIIRLCTTISQLLRRLSLMREHILPASCP
jgi:hypothetical protein